MDSHLLHLLEYHCCFDAFLQEEASSVLSVRPLFSSLKTSELWFLPLFVQFAPKKRKKVKNNKKKAFTKSLLCSTAAQSRKKTA